VTRLRAALTGLGGAITILRSLRSNFSSQLVGPAQVHNCVGRYAHRVAIPNHRLVPLTRRGLLPLEGLHRDANCKEDDDPHGRRVHPPLPDPCAAERIIASGTPASSAPAIESTARALPPTPQDGPGWTGGRSSRRLPRRLEALTGESSRECPHCHTGIMVVTRPTTCQQVPNTS
jgi:hypothetical protein